ncbi:hypothetical protein HNY73_015727 [Argiope bruennichi]|uniref:Uncharacterized protein n=1 Tax=Argiope bruennichi TaxID=94029 RepID=A0A8T0EGR1_ARGBR|nr:hypothetical protein HNY73_015727 [Argiope bruennichi]
MASMGSYPSRRVFADRPVLWERTALANGLNTLELRFSEGEGGGILLFTNLYTTPFFSGGGRSTHKKSSLFGGSYAVWLFKTRPIASGV